jgi:hypothetical protein
MRTTAVRFIDAEGHVLATAQVTDEGTHFGGTVNLDGMPSTMRRVFDDFEEIVNGQMFSFLDEIEAKIRALPLRVLFGDAGEVPVRDLQIYPSTGDVSFKLAKEPNPVGQ